MIVESSCCLCNYRIFCLSFVVVAQLELCYSFYDLVNQCAQTSDLDF